MTITPKRHHWTPTDDVGRAKTCRDCGMVAARFGIGRDSYWTYAPAGGSPQEHDTVPPCQPAARFPQRTSCRYCKLMLERTGLDEPWTSAMGPGTTGRTPECHSAPNPNDGPMPPHEPGTAIVSPPVEAIERTQPDPPHIPMIPRS